VGVHRDDGISGAALDRPAYRTWLDDAAHGRAGVLLAWRFDRISREGLPAVAKLIEVLKASGARLLTSGDRVDSEAPGFRITAAVLSEVAHAEREAIRARVSPRQAADRARGAWTNTRPYGYDVTPERRLVKRPGEAEIVRRIVDEYLAGGALRRIAINLTADGIPTPRDSRGERTPSERTSWGLTTVRHILTSPTTAGLYPHRGDPLLDERGEPVVVSDDPIATEEERARILARLAARTVEVSDGSRRTGSGRPARALLSGILRCGECRGPMTYQARRDSGRAANYRCGSRSHGHTCSGVSVRAEEVEAEVAFRVLSRLAALDVEDPLLAAVAERWTATERPEEVDRRRIAAEDVEAARTALERIEDAFADGLLERERYARQRERLMGRLERAEKRVAEMPATVDVSILLDGVLSREAWDDANTEARRVTLGLALAGVDVVKDEAGGVRLIPRFVE
jgi:DNA invertase Pin-like site-specific DNA recombinase